MIKQHVRKLRKTPVKEIMIRLNLDRAIEWFFLPRTIDLMVNDVMFDYSLYRLGTYLRWSQISSTENFWSEAGYSKLFAELISSNDVVYDIGSDHGYYSLLSVAAGAGGVIAFEPHPVHYQATERNIEQNCLGILTTVHQLALTDQDRGEVELGLRHPEIAAEHSVSVPTSRLDAVISNRDDPPPDVLKVDVEGAEGALLDGAHNTIATHRPTVTIEMHDRDMVSSLASSWEDIYEFLTGHDYRLNRIGWEDNKVTTDILAPPSTGEKHFLIAIPDESGLPIPVEVIESVSNID